MPRLLARIFLAVALAASRFVSPHNGRNRRPARRPNCLPESLATSARRGAGAGVDFGIFEQLKADDFGVTSQARRIRFRRRPDFERPPRQTAR